MMLNATGASGWEVRYSVTQRGAPCLLVGGYGFVARKRRGSRVYWTCRSRNSFGCTARALTREGQLVTHHLQHNHPPNKQTELKRIESLIEIITVEK